MVRKAQVMDEAAVSRALARITHEIIERNRGVDGICILGVRRRGVPLAKTLCDNILHFEGKTVPMGVLDVTLHRDDLHPEEKQAALVGSEIPFDVTDKDVLIVDDVMYTGRTARAAIETVFSFGRPRSVQLVALVDRGHRELPIRPDYVGKNLPTAKTEVVTVLTHCIDGESAVYICDR